MDLSQTQGGQVAQQAPQNPFQPASMPDVMTSLAAYRAKVQELTSGATAVTGNDTTEESLSQNPWAPDEVNPNKLSQEDRDHQAWLATQPVAAQQNTQFDEETHQHILRNLLQDPAMGKIEQPFFEVMDQLHQLVKAGHITKQEALAHLQEAAPMIDSALHEHHGPHSPSHTQSLTVDPDLHRQPEALTKRGGK